MHVTPHQYYRNRLQSKREDITAAVKELAKMKKKQQTPKDYKEIHRLQKKIARLYIQLEELQTRLSPYSF